MAGDITINGDAITGGDVTTTGGGITGDTTDRDASCQNGTCVADAAAPGDGSDPKLR